MESFETKGNGLDLLEQAIDELRTALRFAPSCGDVVGAIEFTHKLRLVLHQVLLLVD